jgi:uncharacterized protein (TIGR02996 family)
MEAQDIVETWYRRAFEEGRREGFQEALLAALRRRFGVEADARVEQRVARASLDQLETWIDHLLSASSLPELLTVAKSPAAALLTEVIADPRSIEPRLVYADALLEAGDPRGELIHVQCALETLHADDPARAKLEARAADLLALHEPTWTHDLRELCTLYENRPKLVFRRGFVENATLYASHAREIVASMATQTPLRELSLLHEDPIEDLAGVPALDPDEAALLAAADLPELRVLSAGGLDDRAAVILARARNKPWLQRLVLTGHGLTDDGAIAIANATGIDRIASLWLVAPEVTEVGATALRKRFGHRAEIFSGGSPSWFARTSPF